ncbi:ABC transporter permease [Egibacter rhizosphaerae]|uniref:ABC transporter permease n=2 Tax=Egibacter rhizosphaerae TaxID=1670831 RepID=A0A411YLS2_9ACTN|nr:ABC transporter permease [Egibacter rhizosphaerae]
MGFLEYFIDNPGRALELSIEHATLVLAGLALGGVVGILIGMLAYTRPVASSISTAAAATILTIPSFALFGLMLPLFGLGNSGPIVALAAYALLPIVRNTVTGLQEVDPAVVESARGMGMSRRQVLWRVELPLAWPVILAGLRVATMVLTSIAAIAAYIGAMGWGQEVTRALQNIGSVWALDVALAATVGIVVVALVLDLLWTLLRRFTTPRGMR